MYAILYFSPPPDGDLSCVWSVRVILFLRSIKLTQISPGFEEIICAGKLFMTEWTEFRHGFHRIHEFTQNLESDA